MNKMGSEGQATSLPDVPSTKDVRSDKRVPCPDWHAALAGSEVDFFFFPSGAAFCLHHLMSLMGLWALLLDLRIIMWPISHVNFK